MSLPRSGHTMLQCNNGAAASETKTVSANHKHRWADASSASCMYQLGVTDTCMHRHCSHNIDQCTQQKKHTGFRSTCEQLILLLTAYSPKLSYCIILCMRNCQQAHSESWIDEVLLTSRSFLAVASSFSALCLSVLTFCSCVSMSFIFLVRLSTSDFRLSRSVLTSLTASSASAPFPCLPSYKIRPILT